MKTKVVVSLLTLFTLFGLNINSIYAAWNTYANNGDLITSVLWNDQVDKIIAHDNLLTNLQTQITNMFSGLTANKVPYKSGTTLVDSPMTISGTDVLFGGKVKVGGASPGTWTTNGSDIFLNSGVAGSSVILRPNGDGSTTGQAAVTTTGIGIGRNIAPVPISIVSYNSPTNPQIAVRITDAGTDAYGIGADNSRTTIWAGGKEKMGVYYNSEVRTLRSTGSGTSDWSTKVTDNVFYSSNGYDQQNANRGMIALDNSWNGVPILSTYAKRQADANYDNYRIYTNYDTAGMNPRGWSFWAYTSTPGNGGGCGWGGCVGNILNIFPGFNDTVNPAPTVQVGGDLSTSSNGASLGTMFAGGGYVVQGIQNGGVGKGLYMWQRSDCNWGIYMGESGAGRSLCGGSATAGDNFSSYAIRFRSSNNIARGFIFENSAEQNLFSIRGDGYASFLQSVIINRGNTTGAGIWLSDDGDWVDNNDSYGTFRFTGGIAVTSANKGGSIVIKLKSDGAVETNKIRGLNSTGDVCIGNGC